MKTRVLMIDDEKNIGSLISDYLTEFGYDVTVVSTLTQARAVLAGPELPNILLLDVMLPDGNGFDFLVEVRSSPRTKTMPVIMASAHKIDAHDRIRGLDDGADDYLTKPFDMGELRSRIDRLLARIERIRQIPAESIASVQAAPVERAPKPLPVRREPFFRRFMQVLLLPGKFFRATSQPDALFSLLLLSIFSAGMGLQRGFEESSLSVGTISVLAFLIGTFGFVAFFSWLLQWILGLQQKAVGFRKIFEGISVGFAPLALSSLLGLLYVIVGNGKMGDFTAGPLLLFPAQATSSITGFALRHLDVFEIWSVPLMGLGFAAASGQRKRGTLLLFGVIWLLGMTGFGLLQGLTK